MPESRKNSFNSPSSPFVRRNSFLSEDMVKNEDYHVYELSNYYSSSSYSILSLKESQGFIFNQDLFASPYEQLRSLANERMRRKSMSKDHNMVNTTKRRNTSFHPSRPVLVEDDEISAGNIKDNTHEHAVDDDDTMYDKEHQSNSDEIEEDDQRGYSYDDSGDESNDDYDNMTPVYGGSVSNRNYKVIVKDIELNEVEADIYPQ